jgi:hypothetical protein
MSRGPGHVQQVIREMIEAEPNGAWTTDEICRRVYAGASIIEKKHRVSVLRSLRQIKTEIGTWSFDRVGQNGEYCLYDCCNDQSQVRTRFIDYISKNQRHGFSIDDFEQWKLKNPERVMEAIEDAASRRDSMDVGSAGSPKVSLVKRTRNQNAAKPKKLRGNPISFYEDPDRYHIALYMYLCGEFQNDKSDSTFIAVKNTKRESALAVAAWTVGKNVAPTDEAIAACPDGHFVRSWPLDGLNTKVGIKAGTIQGRADTIRKKERKYSRDIDALRWLLFMSKAFGHALSPDRNTEKRKNQVLLHAEAVNELDYALREMIPMCESAIVPAGYPQGRNRSSPPREGSASESPPLIGGGLR